ncbi:hypothetical protein D3C75_901330 [compost metagenome]
MLFAREIAEYRVAVINQQTHRSDRYWPVHALGNRAEHRIAPEIRTVIAFNSIIQRLRLRHQQHIFTLLQQSQRFAVKFLEDTDTVKPGTALSRIDPEIVALADICSSDPEVKYG